MSWQEALAVGAALTLLGYLLRRVPSVLKAAQDNLRAKAQLEDQRTRELKIHQIIHTAVLHMKQTYVDNAKKTGTWKVAATQCFARDTVLLTISDRLEAAGIQLPLSEMTRLMEAEVASLKQAGLKPDGKKESDR